MHKHPLKGPLMQDATAAKPKMSPAMKFLWIIALLTIALVLLGVLYRLFEPQITRWALVPGHSFVEDSRAPAPDYASPDAWAAHPDKRDNPAREAPSGYSAAPLPQVAVFFVHPTTYLNRKRWNAPLDDAEANRRIDQSLRHQASPFNGIGAIWAPRYRQATFGAFLVPATPSAQRALALAYRDVLAAFDAFIAAVPARDPIILAGHSQGALHLRQLLKDRIAGTPLRQRLVAAYVVGWPVSLTADLPALGGIPPCATPQATGCIVSWMSFGDTKGAAAMRTALAFNPGLTGRPLAGTALVCTNPISFWADQRAAPAEANLGALEYFPTGTPLGTLRPGLTGAACTADGFVILDPPPGEPFTELKMPGENYHTYDINLFWANVRANSEARANAFVLPPA